MTPPTPSHALGGAQGEALETLKDRKALHNSMVQMGEML